MNSNNLILEKHDYLVFGKRPRQYENFIVNRKEMGLLPQRRKSGFFLSGHYMYFAKLNAIPVLVFQYYEYPRDLYSFVDLLIWNAIFCANVNKQQTNAFEKKENFNYEMIFYTMKKSFWSKWSEYKLFYMKFLF